MNKETRIKFNTSIIEAIENKDKKITPDQARNNFTGLGGLHSLNRDDYSNYWEFSKAKRAEELGQFFTPLNIVTSLQNCFEILPAYNVGDLACGSGNFFNSLKCNIYGNEKEENAVKVAQFIYPKAKIDEGDLYYCEPNMKFDIIFGNPPFNFKIEDEDGNFQLSQLEYINTAAKHIKPNGFLCVITPAKFMNDGFFEKSRIERVNENFSFICQAKLPANSFSAAIDTKVMFFQAAGLCKMNQYSPETFINFDDLKSKVLPLSKLYNSDKSKLVLFERKAAFNSDPATGAKILKLMFEIKQHKALKEKYFERATEKIEEFKNQKKPYRMDEKEWSKEKIKESDILNTLQKWVKNQNKTRLINTVRTLQTKYEIGVKAYGPHPDIRKIGFKKPLFEVVTDPLQTPVIPAFKKIVNKKRKLYTAQSQHFNAMERNQAIDAFLNDFSLNDVLNPGTPIKLNEMQKNDLGLCFQKRYSILQWQQGSGKSVAGMCWISFLKNNVKNTVLLAPAVAVNLTWEPRLLQYGYDFRTIKTKEDLRSVKAGEILLISFNQVTKLTKELQEFTKTKGQKIALLVDESDELTNYQSNRTKATLAAFRRCKYKLLTTGTTTRNNINELYGQLELLYNNSFNMLNNCEHKYFVTKSGEIESSDNLKQFQPFPARYGNNDFRFCFSPRKSSVFGIEKDTQDVYNTDHLKDILQRTIITRTFEQITGEKKYKIKTHSILQGENEREVYVKIIEEFQTMCSNYYQSTGSSKKDAMLRLIRQIQLLIKSTSTPHKFVEYNGGKELPHKYYKIFDLLTEWSSEKVAIGCVFKEAAGDYYSKIKAKFPNRTVFYIDGSTTFNNRKKVIRDFEETTNGILVSTQQSLKSSVNIPTCDKCIIESLQWNIPKISQYFFRFIRYDSKNSKEVHFVTYADTIEVNILALLMAKEKLNNFIKTMDMQERADLYSDFDIDISILDSVVRKEQDQDGHMQLTWGKQNLVG